jgi:hypothetical protein
MPGLRREGPARTQQVDAAEAAIGAPLPPPYRELLQATDGLSLLDGHLRLLGAADLIRWNDLQTWKHAWHHPPVDFICFGGTSIGDQWVWRLTDLAQGADAAVAVLDGFELTETPLASTTTLFLSDVLPLLATTQVDDLVALAHQRFGPLARSALLIAAPPAQFGVQGLVDRMAAMSDTNVMTALGDVARQLQVMPDRPVKRFDTVTDERGRLRLRLVFE